MAPKNRGWIKKRINDPYLKKAHKENYLSRAVYKLDAVNRKTRFLKGVTRVLDLGSAPGSWLQFLQRKLPKNALIVGLDIIPIRSIDASENVKFHQVDIFSPEAEHLLENYVNAGGKFHAIVSDMAPSTTGRKDVDCYKSYLLVQKALQLAKLFLTVNGHFIAKIFQGEETELLKEEFASDFKKIRVISPDATPKGSKELFLHFAQMVITREPDDG